jgi:hypothetical protein
MMKSNDTLTVKRSVTPKTYMHILLQHRAETGCKVVRLEALGSAIPNLIRVAEMLEISGICTKENTKIKPRRLKVNEDDLDPISHGSPVVCKFLECMKITMKYTDDILLFKPTFQ